MDDQVTSGRALTDLTREDASPGRLIAGGGRLGDWLMLLLVLIVSAVPMLVVVGQADSKRTMENIAVLSAQETWLRQHGWQDIEPDPNAWLMPTNNGNPRIVKPPMVIWLDMLSWTGLTPADSTAQQLIYRARVVSVMMGLMVVAGVFWIGRVLGDRKLAIMAALAAGTCMFLTRQSRIASYDMHMTGWATLAVASAIWAMRPFGPEPGWGRAVFGWCLAGVALAGAFMSKGPLALLAGVAPVVSTIYVIQSRQAISGTSLLETLSKRQWRLLFRTLVRTMLTAPRIQWRYVLGLCLMLLVAAALTAPWYLYLFSEVSNAQSELLHEYKAERMEFQTPFYYLGLLGLMVPWSVWLVGAIAQPFMRASGAERRRLLVSWVWFVLIFVAFSIPGAKQQRYILPILPAAALLIGQLWRYHEHLAEQGKVDPGVNMLRVPHWLGVVCASLLAWPFFTSQHWMLDRGWFEKIPIGDVSHTVAAPVAVVLIVLAVLGAVWHFKWKPMRAAVVMALWSAVLFTLIWYAWSLDDRTNHPVRASAERIGEVVDGGVVGMLSHNKYPVLPNEEMLLYARRIIPPVKPRELPVFSQRSERVYIAAPRARETRGLLKRNGYERIETFQHDYDEQLDLWLYIGDRDATVDDGANGAEFSPAGSP